MRNELLTVIVDAVASVILAAIGIWIVPEYREFALLVVAALQGIAAALVVYFVSERKIAALRTTIKQLMR